MFCSNMLEIISKFSTEQISYFEVVGFGLKKFLFLLMKRNIGWSQDGHYWTEKWRTILCVWSRAGRVSLKSFISSICHLRKLHVRSPKGDFFIFHFFKSIRRHLASQALKGDIYDFSKVFFFSKYKGAIY